MNGRRVVGTDLARLKSDGRCGAAGNPDQLRCVALFDPGMLLAPFRSQREFDVRRAASAHRSADCQQGLPPLLGDPFGGTLRRAPKPLMDPRGSYGVGDGRPCDFDLKGQPSPGKQPWSRNALSASTAASQSESASIAAGHDQDSN